MNKIVIMCMNDFINEKANVKLATTVIACLIGISNFGYIVIFGWFKTIPNKYFVTNQNCK